MILLHYELMVQFLKLLSGTAIFESHGFVFVEENVGFHDGSVGNGLIKPGPFV
jgi:hypothetical protein